MSTYGPKRLRIIVFPGVQNLPAFAAEENGFFAERGISLETTFTTSSKEQRDGLAQGKYDFAHAAVDNAVAMVDAAGEDVVIVIGLDHGFNKLVVQPGITTYEGLRGKTLGVDAPDTAFALIAYDMLKRKGLDSGDYRVQPVGATRFRLEVLKQRTIDFALLNLPFNIFAQRAGLAVLDDPARVIGAYQSTGGFAKREWAERHRAVLTDYLAAYVRGLRWSMDPANRAAATRLLELRMSLPPDVAAECFRQISDPTRGFAQDAALNRAGMETLLRLRSSFSGRPHSGPERYLDESYYRDALAGL